ncbi:methylenetetrahydrofolate reductase [NAD(P)H] [Conexibacter arvalis]|uniref:Methylenetetrahydrofolate reductase n=1 Tax=Conexibacter arvalis TaxID=912552 RepID=A0A840IGZ1_9ACTN|nr:methylenetetrahydrofolate reductase [NAD(P)H] [Conexibacter arvalis]MBB4663220.1 methylenetetrahydrofolate reductase (NADPH) [Conexibacter arvalis]
MRIDEIIAAGGEPVFSFEFFPPKSEEGEARLFAALEALRPLEPAFVSVTWGAGGSTRTKTIEIVSRIRDNHDLEAMAHFTCVGATRDDLHTALKQMRAAGIQNVLALRGDPPKGETTFRPTEDGLAYASDLTRLVAEGYPEMCLVGACYPEVHTEATDRESDLRHLKEKVDAGARVLITQLFFDNAHYYRFVEDARAVGIDVPIVPGIMPIISAAGVKRMTALGGSTIPPALLEALEARADDEEAVAELGVAYATLQCAELLANGAPGIHFYTINRSPATRAILSALRLQRPWEKGAGAEPALKVAAG